MGTCPDILKVSKVSNKSDLLKPGAILKFINLKLYFYEVDTLLKV